MIYDWMEALQALKERPALQYQLLEANDRRNTAEAQLLVAEQVGKDLLEEGKTWKARAERLEAALRDILRQPTACRSTDPVEEARDARLIIAERALQEEKQ